MIDLAILGAGRVTREVHLPVVAGIPGVNIRTIADPDESARRRAAALAPGARTCAHWTEALAHPCHAVLVALPANLHEEASLEAASRGLHLYLEKPGALNHGGARRIADAARSSRLVCHLGYHLRFDPRVAAMRTLLKHGRLGRPFLVRTFFGIPSADVPPWKRTAPAGGALLELSTHHFDLLRFLLDGSPQVVEARIDDDPFHEAAMHARLDLPGGACAEVCCTLDGPEAHELQVFGTEGILGLDRYRDWNPRHRARHPTSLPATLVHSIKSAPAALRYALSKAAAPWSDPAYFASWRDFLAQVRHSLDGLPPPATLAASADDAAEALRLVEETRTKARTP
jgi:predicted dehydrogenase